MHPARDSEVFPSEDPGARFIAFKAHLNRDLANGICGTHARSLRLLKSVPDSKWVPNPTSYLRDCERLRICGEAPTGPVIRV